MIHHDRDRIWTRLVALIGLLGAGAGAAPGLRVSLETRPGAPRGGDRVDLILVIENRSSSDVELQTNWESTTVVARYENGRDVPRTIFGRMLAGEDTPNQPPKYRHGGSGRSVRLRAGERAVEEFPLSLVYDLSAQGKYRIGVRREYVRLDATKGEVVAEEIEVQVARPEIARMRLEALPPPPEKPPLPEGKGGPTGTKGQSGGSGGGAEISGSKPDGAAALPIGSENDQKQSGSDPKSERSGGGSKLVIVVALLALVLGFALWKAREGSRSEAPRAP